MYKLKRFIYYLFHKPSVLLVMLLESLALLIPDTLYLKIKYRLLVGRKLNLKKPVTFSEKIQWLKLHNRKPEYTLMVDKVKVKEYVAEKLGTDCIIPTLGVWDNPDEIDFDALPSRFVLKCNHNSGTGMCVCKDKSTIDIPKVKTALRKGLEENYFLHGREWPYKHVQRKIIAEQFMIDSDQEELRDYKFFCFGGKPYLCQVISERSSNEKIDFYDMEWNRLVGLVGLINSSSCICNSKDMIPCPLSFADMKRMASTLSRGIPFVRIDFYDINGKAYFGEITFFAASGFGVFYPDEWNEKLGRMIDLSTVSH